MTNGYVMAHSGAIFIDRSVEGRFELTDRDRLDLLHRMSTNGLADLQPGQGRATVLTTALARIIDRLVIYARNDTALAVCGIGRTKMVRGWLQKHIFFQDKVKTRDVGAETCQFGLFGTQAESIANHLSGAAASLPLHHFVEFTLDGTPVSLARTYPLAGNGFTLIGPVAARDVLRQKLEQLGATEADDATYEMLRIEAALPRETELTEDYLPLEAGLWDEIDFKKGCYIGQEIIARMESRHKLARTLAKLRFPVPISAGTRLRVGERDAGTITSAAVYPDGQCLALGYVRVEMLDQPLVALPEDGQPVPIDAIEAAAWPETT